MMGRFRDLRLPRGLYPGKARSGQVRGGASVRYTAKGVNMVRPDLEVAYIIPARLFRGMAEKEGGMLSSLTCVAST